VESSEQQPIVIKKKVTGHGGHHGGAWKVAYADFVTAMMALFIVLWLMNTKPPVKEAIAGYFRDPAGHAKNAGSGQAGVGEGVVVGKDDMGQLKDKLQSAIAALPEFKSLRDQVQFTVTGEGLRVELLEAARETFFTSGNAVPTQNGQDLIQMLARELGKLPNEIVIEGHTDAKPYASATYSNWELSADRANAARKLMDTSGLRTRQVVQVRGFADVSLRDAAKPEDPSNRRVSVIVRYQQPPAGAAQPVPQAEAKKPSPAPHGKGHS
jgi:chemotaxis protein MotB